MFRRWLFATVCLATLILPSSPGAGPVLPGGMFTPLASPAAPGSGQPNLAVGPGGTLWLSWLEPRGPSSRALCASRLDGGRWTRPITIVTGDSLLAIGADIPALLLLPPRRLVALYPWRFPTPGHAREVRLIQSADGGRSWGAPVVANRDHTPTEHGFASLVADSLGARAVWLDGRNSAVTDSTGRQAVLEEGLADMVVRSAVLTKEGALTDERELDARACDCCPTAAAATPHGALVAYRDRSPAEVRDIAVLRYEGGLWTGPRPVHEDGWKIEGCPVNGPAIAVAGERVAVAWYTAAQDTHRVRLAFSDDGGVHFGEPVRLDQGSPTGRAALVLLPDGGVLAAWLEDAESGSRLVACRVAPGGVAGLRSTVAAIPSGRGGAFPRMARSGDRVLLAWTEPGKPSQVRTALARLEPTPAR
jgi:hypothetical protein